MGEICEICEVATHAWRDLLATNHLDDPDRPVLSLEETPESYRLRAEHVGLDPDRVSIQTERDVLRIEGRLETPPPPWDLLAPLRGAQVAHFARVFRLQDPIDPTRSRVFVDDGVLEVTLMKASSPGPTHAVAC
ncbi:MAG: Hsp20/alpha crystallin family protein [Nannocystaceae bacterium]